MNVELDNSLLSKEQAELYLNLIRLNPLIITIKKAEGMPSKPLNFNDLDQMCNPCSAKFQFFSDPHLYSVITEKKHSSNVEFGSEHLIFLGLLDQKVLVDSIKHEKLLIEIHDRDFKYSKNYTDLHGGFFKGGTIRMNMNPQNSYGYAEFGI